MRRRQELTRVTEQAIPAPEPAPAGPSPLKAKDSVVNVNGDGIWISKKDVRLKGRESQYVPVVPSDLDRKNAVQALQTMSQRGDDGEISDIVHAGQLVNRNHPLVQLNPGNVRYPDPE
jgi:hypothetical protein